VTDRRAREGSDPMQLHMTTDDVPERNRFEAWNDALFSTFAISARPLPDAERQFRAHFSARTSGPLLHGSFDVAPYRAMRKSAEIAHRHWDSYWIYRESGSGALHSSGGQELVSRSGDLLVGETDIPIEAWSTDHYDHEVWLLPKALVDPHLPASGRPIFARLSGHNGVGALAAGYLEVLTRNWDSIAETTMGRVADTLGRLLGIACGAAAAQQPDAVRAGRLTQVKRHIDHHLADPDLSPANVAAALGISVRTLHLLFEPTGITFARHMLRRRLEECRYALLANPSRPVIDIVFAWGFSSLSSFYRAFHTNFGMSPGDLREAARAAHRV
jgi:AraC-like DNA-binding protein